MGRLITVPSTIVGQVPLSDLVRSEDGTGPSQITRTARARSITITCNVAPGFAEGDLVCISPQPAGLANTMPPSEEAAKLSAASDSQRSKRTEISVVPLIFRIGKITPGATPDQAGTLRLTFNRLSDS